MRMSYWSSYVFSTDLASRWPAGSPASDAMPLDSMGFKKFAKKNSATRFFREPIAVLGRFPFEQRSSPPRSAAQQHWPGPLSLPPLERGPGHFALWYDNKVKNHDEFSRNHPDIDGKLSGRCLQYR